jgi:putative ABC transport system substrate-binding protein
MITAVQGCITHQAAAIVAGGMRRRQFLALASAALVWPAEVRAQQPMPVIGFLNGGLSQEYGRAAAAAFLQGLGEIGYAEGRNVLIEYRWAEGHYDRMPALAADLVRRQVAVIAANTQAAPVAKAATTTIPIVFVTASDPVAGGLVASLSRPGGNLTGTALLNVEVGPKRLELLHELVPSATAMGLLINSANPNAEAQINDMHATARRLGLQLHVLHASTEQDFEMAFATLVKRQVGALAIGGDVFYVNRSKQLAELSFHHALPAIFVVREFVAAGGLMSYGVSLTEGYRLMGVYAGRILKGEKPADLPVQQSTKVELIINLKTAKALGLTIPLPLLGRADEVIE